MEETKKKSPQKRGGLGKGYGAILSGGMEEETAGGITMVRIGEVEPNQNQPRKIFDAAELESLSESISQYGMIQPITVRMIGDRYQIITGERRWRAARMAGLSEIPVIVITADDKKTAELALIENIQRSDLNPIEEALGFSSLIEEFGLTQDEAAKHVGRSRAAVTNSLRLLSLPESVRARVAAGELSAGHAKVLLGICDPERLTAAAEQVITKDLSVRDTERLVKIMNMPAAEPVRVVHDVDHTRALELLVQKKLGRTVKISEKGKNHTVTIGYSDNEDLEALLKLLCGDSILDNL